MLLGDEDVGHGLLVGDFLERVLEGRAVFCDYGSGSEFTAMEAKSNVPTWSSSMA